MTEYRVVMDFRTPPALELIICANSESDAKRKAHALAPEYGFNAVPKRTLIIRHQPIQQVAA